MGVDCFNALVLEQRSCTLLHFGSVDAGEWALRNARLQCCSKSPLQTLGDTLKRIQKFIAFAVMAVLCTGCLLWSCILLRYFVPAHAVWEARQPREHVKPADLKDVGRAISGMHWPRGVIVC